MNKTLTAALAISALAVNVVGAAGVDGINGRLDRHDKRLDFLQDSLVDQVTRLNTVENDVRENTYSIANTTNQVNINTKDIADLKGRIGANVTVSSGDNITVNEDSGNFMVATSNDLQLNSVSLNDGNNESAYTTEGINMTYRGDGASGLEHHASYKYDGMTIRSNDGDANDVSYISLTDNGLNNGNKRITNVDKGIKGTDAVNVNQLNGGINQLNTRINKLGASSAALAGLHPLDFNRNDKVSYAVSYGHYRNSNAVALGVFARPNERIMLGFGATLGGENQYTVNVAFKTGKGSDYIAEAKDAQSRISKLEALVAKLMAEIEK